MEWSLITPQHFENIIIIKNDTYLTPIPEFADRKLLILPFPMHGAVGDEVTLQSFKKLPRLSTPTTNNSKLSYSASKSGRLIMLSLHKGAARYYEARLGLWRAPIPLLSLTDKRYR